MLTGKKEIRQGIILCQPVSLNNARAFTLIEVLFAALIGAFIVGVLFYILNLGSQINQVSSRKIMLQSQARRITDWIAQDLRETVRYSIKNNNPTNAHIRFQRVLGRGVVEGTYQLEVNYIDYTYDSGLHRLTRSIVTDTGVLANTAPNPNSWFFNDIMTEPFSTRDDAGSSLDLDAVSEIKRVVVLIKVQNQTGEEVSLTSEVKIRNE